MKLLQTLAVLAGTALFFVTHAQNEPEKRQWTLSPTDRASHAQFKVERTQGFRRMSHSAPIAWAELSGVTAEQAAKLNSTAKFQVVRDAGKLLCEGSFHWGRGSGSFAFQPNPQYRAELQKLGFELTGDGNTQEFDYFMIDVPLDFARAVNAAGLHASSQELFEMRVHGLTKEFIRDMQASGYPNLLARDFIQLKIHGVETAFIADLKKAGYNLPVERIIEMKIHGVSREFIQSLHAYGLKPLAEEIVEFRIHGVDAAYLRKLKDAGYENLSAAKIVQLKIHGVD